DRDGGDERRLEKCAEGEREVSHAGARGSGLGGPALQCRTWAAELPSGLPSPEPRAPTPEPPRVSACGTRHPTIARLELGAAASSGRNPFMGSALAPSGSWYEVCLSTSSWTSPAHPSPRPVAM